MTLVLGVAPGPLAWPAAEAAASAKADRPAHWAQPLVVEGVPNLHRVSDTLYRSAQPSTEGMRHLQKLGVVTVVNLRSFNSDRKEIGTLDLHQEWITMKAWHPEEKEIIHFLQIVTNPSRTPVLVHCQHGADRTGTMCAVYRIVLQGWTKEEAIREMREGGYGYHSIWRNLPRWIQRLDVEALRKKAGLTGGER